MTEKYLIIDETSSLYEKENNVFISEKFIKERIQEITREIKSITDSSMATSFKLNSLRAVKKELKSLLISE